VDILKISQYKGIFIVTVEWVPQNSGIF